MQPSDEAIVHAVKLLREDNAADAAKQFSSEYSSKHEALISAFATAYANGHRFEDRLKVLDTACAMSGPPRMTRHGGIGERYQMAALADDARVDPERQRRLKLCTVQALGALEYNRRARALMVQLDSLSKDKPNIFKPLERASLTYWRLDTALPNARAPGIFELPNPPKLDFTALEEAAKGLAQALSTIDENAADGFISDARAACALEGRTTRFCSGLPSRLVASRPRSPFMNLDVAISLSERAHDVESEHAALEQAERVEALVEQVPESDRWRVRAWLSLVRHMASQWRWRAFASEERTNTEKGLFELADTVRRHQSAGAPRLADIGDLAVRAARYGEDLNHIGEVINRSRMDAPADPSWDIHEFFIAVRAGKREKAAQIILRATGAGLPDPSSPWAVPMAFAVAVIPETLKDYQLIQNAGASQTYPIHARLLAACGHGKGERGARDELTPAWERIKPETWRERLDQQDASVWGELLLSDFMGKTEGQELLKTLDVDFKASPLAKIGMTLEQFRCELFFYQALKLRITRGNRDPEVRRLLQDVVKTGEAGYFEFDAAKFLLK